MISPPLIHLKIFSPQAGSKWPEKKFRVCRSQNWRRPLRQELSSSMSLESDYLVLKCHGYSCFEKDFYYRLPTKKSYKGRSGEVLPGDSPTRLELIETEPLVVSVPIPRLVRIGTLGRGPTTLLVSENSGPYGSSLCKTEMEDMTGERF